MTQVKDFYHRNSMRGVKFDKEVTGSEGRI